MDKPIFSKGPPYSANPATIEVVDHEMADILRAKTVAERLEISWGMWRFARDMLRNILRGEHPDWSQEEIDREVARRLSHGAC
jgi:Rv0078B-related antitoxin